MSQRGSVVVGVDFSAPSRRALELAIAVSARAGAPLELLHAWNAGQLAGPGEVVPSLEASLAQQKELRAAQLDAWAAEARAAGAEASARVVEGAASRAIPARARAATAALVVVGRRGSANLDHVLLGSVSERVLHLATCPVLVVPEKPDPPRPPERLLVGVDFSRTSEDAYRAALRLAEQLGASRGLLLVHARPGERELQLEGSGEHAYRAEYPYDEAALKRWAKLPADCRVPLELRVLEGQTEPLLLSAAEREACDWLVLGLQGRNALAALLMGSTTDRVLKLSDRPVLVVPTTSHTPGEAAS